MKKKDKYTQEEMVERCNKDGIFLNPILGTDLHIFTAGNQIGMTPFAIPQTIFVLKDDVNGGQVYLLHKDLEIEPNDIGKAVNDMKISDTKIDPINKVSYVEIVFSKNSDAVITSKLALYDVNGEVSFLEDEDKKDK